MLFRLASASALVAAATLVAAPLAASPLSETGLPRAGAPGAAGVLGTNAVNAQDYRWHRRDRVDAGDVVAGVLVLGTIAAIASAASRNTRDRDYRYPQRYPYPDRPYDYRSPSTEWRNDAGRGIERAVDMCAREVERTARLGTVDEVDRTDSGWRVSGRLDSGSRFTCSIGNDGRIDAIDYGDRGAVNDSQWDDDRYAAARRAQDGTAVPAYPGGPVGDEQPVEDGRYDADAAPDFQG